MVLTYLGRKLQEQPMAPKHFVLSSNYFPSKEQHQYDYTSDWGCAPSKLFNSLENSLHMTHFRYPQVLKIKKKGRKKEKRKRKKFTDKRKTED